MSISPDQVEERGKVLRISDCRTKSKDQEMKAFPLQTPVERVVRVVTRLRGEHDAAAPLRIIEVGYFVVARILYPKSRGAPRIC